MIRLLASPRLARCEKSFTESISLRPASMPPLMPKVTMEPWPSGRYLLRQLVVRAGWQARILHPGNGRILLQPFGHRQRVAAVLLHAEFQRLDALNEQEGIERADAGAEIAQALHAHLDDVGQVAEHFAEHHAVIARAGLGDGGVFIGMSVHGNLPLSTMMPPMEVPWPPRNLVAEWTTISAPCSIGRQRYGEAMVLSIDQRHAGFVRDGGHLFDIQHVHARVGDGLAVDGAGLGRDGLAEIFGIVRLHELHVDAQAAEADIELRVGAAVEGAGGRSARRPAPSGW